MDSCGNLHVYHTDGVGSVRAITNGNGTPVAGNKTDAFGVPLKTSGNTSQPFQYAGQQKDGSGLYYLRARYYDTATGRFLSRDPAFGLNSQPCTLNRFAYAYDNPVNYSDPSGFDPHNHLCSGVFDTAAGTVIFQRSPFRSIFSKPPAPGTLSWRLFISRAAQEALGDFVEVSLVMTLVNNRAVNPPYDAHLKELPYDFHGSMLGYDYTPGSLFPLGQRHGQLHPGDNLKFLWNIIGYGGMAQIFIDCNVPAGMGVPPPSLGSQVKR